MTKKKKSLQIPEEVGAVALVETQDMFTQLNKQEFRVEV